MEDEVKIIDVKNLKDVNIRENYLKFIDAESPICNITIKVDVSNLVKYKKKNKFNAMMMFCVQNAAEKTDICHYQIRDKETMFWYKHVCTNMVVYAKNGFCYFPSVDYTTDFKEYQKKYIKNCQYCIENNTSLIQEKQSCMSTTCLKDLDIQALSVGFSTDFLCPYVVWGKIVKKFFKSYVSVSLRFHHSIYAGKDVSEFLIKLQKEIKNFKI